MEPERAPAADRACLPLRADQARGRVNLKVKTDSDAYADNKVYEYLEKKLGDVVDALAVATGEGKEDLLSDVLGQAAEQGLSLEQLHQLAIEQGQKRVEETIDEKAKHLQEIMEKPEMTGMFKGLPRFNLDDYVKVRSRVTSDHLDFSSSNIVTISVFGYRDEGGNRFSFTPSEELAELAAERQKRDPYAVAGSVSTEKVGNATVDKEVAQKGVRLLRFGDPVFEAMVQHVQYRDFSAVASLDVPAKHLGWPGRGQGTWLLFELQIARTEGKRSLVLRRELASFVVPVGGNVAESKPELIEHVTEAIQGPPRVDVAESAAGVRDRSPGGERAACRADGRGPRRISWRRHDRGRAGLGTRARVGTRGVRGSCGGCVMSELLTAEGYEQTKEKLRDLETRLTDIEQRTDLDAEHLASVRRSYKMMMREYLQDIKLYEARQAKQKPIAQANETNPAKG